MDDATLQAESLKPSRHVWIWVAILMWIVAYFAVLAIGLLNDSEMASTIGIYGLLAVAPLPFIVVVQLGEHSSSARALTMFSCCVAVLVSWSMVILTVMAAYAVEGGLAPGGGQRAFVAFALAGLAVMAGFYCYLPAGRAFAARWLPIDPKSFSAATALSMTVAVTAFLLIPLAVTGKVGMELIDKAKLEEIKTRGLSLIDLIAQLVGFVLIAIVAGGFPIRRSFRDTMTRLGVGRIGLPVAGIAVAIAVALVCVVLPLLAGVQWLWQQFGWPTTDEKAFEQMLVNIKNWYGAIIIGVVAGISEEILVRGLLQPRLGLVLSNLLFTAGHAFQYGWDVLLPLFLIGLVLGVVRKRYNTTTSMIVHGVYDTIMVLLATYAEDWLKQISGN